MLDPIIISYKLTTNMSVIYYRIQQYPVKYIYNKLVKYIYNKLNAWRHPGRAK